MGKYPIILFLQLIMSYKGKSTKKEIRRDALIMSPTNKYFPHWVLDFPVKWKDGHMIYKLLVLLFDMQELH